MRFDIDVNGEQQMSRDLRRIARNVSDLRPIGDEIADLMMDEAYENFATEGGHLSGGWAPLAESTIRAKGNDIILFRTGDLQGALTERGDAHQVIDMGPDFLIFGTDLPYAELHQTGTGRMPRRRPLEVSPGMRVNILNIIRRYVMTGQGGLI